MAEESLGHAFDQLIDLNSVVDVTLDQEEESADRSPVAKDPAPDVQVQLPAQEIQPIAIPQWLQALPTKPIHHVPTHQSEASSEISPDQIIIIM